MTPQNPTQGASILSNATEQGIVENKLVVPFFFQRNLQGCLKPWIVPKNVILRRPHYFQI